MNYVEDEREMYGDALHAAGFDVTVCADPTCALEQAATVRPDVVVTRILQPHSPIDGIELARQIKQDPRTTDTAIVVTTARIEPHYREAASAVGCDAYLLLPCTPDELIAEISRVLSQRANGR